MIAFNQATKRRYPREFGSKSRRHSERQLGEMFGISAGLAGNIRRKQAYAWVS